MSAPIRLLIHGASGRMGQALLRLAEAREDLQVVAAVSRGQPAQRVADREAEDLSSLAELRAAGYTPRRLVGVEVPFPAHRAQRRRSRRTKLT